MTHAIRTFTDPTEVPPEALAFTAALRTVTPSDIATRTGLRMIGTLGNPSPRGAHWAQPDPLQMALAFGQMIGELYPALATAALDATARGVQQGKKRGLPS